MSGTVEFRLLADTTDWLAETLATLYRDLNRAGRVAILCAEPDRLVAVSDALWANAREHFVTHDFASEHQSPQVQVVLAEQVRLVKNWPVLLNLNYLLDSQDVRFRHISEIVYADPVAVDKARRQYKMYRQAGYHIEHKQL